MKRLTKHDTVLLVTTSYDQAAGLVEKALTDSGEKWFRLNTDKFPCEIKSTYSPRSGFTYWEGTSRVESSEIKAVWYRRNVAPDLPSTTDEHHREFCGREQKAYIEGTLATLNKVKWLSHPAAIARAELKLLQLSIANHIGFVTPVMATTNHPGTVLQMSQEHELIAKAVRSGYVNSAEGFRAIFTTQLTRDDLADLDGLALAPATFQEMVPKKSDIRVTVVGSRVFAAEILSQERESSRIDWRATDDPLLKHRPHCLPNDIAQKCRRLAWELGIDFGAIDLALTEEDSYTFFEINPNGEWLWLQQQLGFPIAESISEWLTQ
jgi:glutathione synthase/RimK-type ligase-like ATP-grasp enzyme